MNLSLKIFQILQKMDIEFKNSDGKIKNNAFDVFAIKYIEILNEFKNYFSYEVLNNEKKSEFLIL